MFVSGYLMDIYYSSYSYWAKMSTKYTVQDCLYIFYSVFFFLSGSMTLLNHFSSSMILLDFEDVDYGTITVFTSLCNSKAELWFQCMKDHATEG